MERDMTAGIPGKIILNFTLPIFIGNMFQQIYNMADTIDVYKRQSYRNSAGGKHGTSSLLSCFRGRDNCIAIDVYSCLLYTA